MTITPGCTCPADGEGDREEHTIRCGWVRAGFPAPWVKCPHCPANFNPEQYFWDITEPGAHLPQHACIPAR